MFQISTFPVHRQSAPGERPPDHFEEQLVGFPKVVTKLLESLAAQRCVRPTFGLIQALVMSCRQQAVEALGGVVIEVVWADPGWKVQEPLGLPQLGEGIPNERVTIHHVNLLPGEYLQPTRKMLVVQTPLQGLVPGVNVAVPDQELLQRLVGLVAGKAVVKDLGVVRHQPLSRIAHDEQQPDSRIHVPYTCRGLGGRKVARGLLYCQLTRDREGHLSPVPSQASAVVFIHIKIVHLMGDRSKLRIIIIIMSGFPALTGAWHDGKCSGLSLHQRALWSDRLLNNLTCDGNSKFLLLKA